MDDIFQQSLSEREKFFQSLGYKIISFQRKWERGIGQLEKDGKEYFVKTDLLLPDHPLLQGRINRTENEVAWYQYIKKYKKSHELAFDVPYVQDHGYDEGLYWLIRESLHGNDLIKQGSSEQEEILKFIPFFVECGNSILHMYDANISTGFTEDKNYIQSYLNLVEKWANLIEETSLLSFIKESNQKIRYKPIHGDFSPINFFKTEDGIFLIDGEYARINGIAYYDIAYFYEYVYSRYEETSAENFLSSFLEVYTLDEDDKNLFCWILATRLIRSYVDCKTDMKVKKENLDRLKSKILCNEIF